MTNIEKHKNRLELFKKYFKEESLEEIKKDWEQLNTEDFGEITIGDFLDFLKQEETIATLSEIQ